MRAANGNITPFTSLDMGAIEARVIYTHISDIGNWAENEWTIHLSRRESLELVAYLARPNTPEWVPAMVRGLEKLGHTDYLILKLVKAARLAKRKRGRHGR